MVFATPSMSVTWACNLSFAEMLAGGLNDMEGGKLVFSAINAGRNPLSNLKEVLVPLINIG